MWSLVWSPVPLDLMEKDLTLSAFLQGPSSWSNLRGSRLMKINPVWASLVVQWLSLPANAGDMGSIPGPERFPPAWEQLSLYVSHNY